MIQLCASSLIYAGYSLETALAEIARVGFRAVDLCAMPRVCVHVDPLQDDAERIRRLLDDFGLRPAALSLYGSDVTRALAGIDFAAALGAPVVVTGRCVRSLDEAIEYLKPLTRRAEARQVVVAPENHVNSPLESPRGDDRPHPCLRRPVATRSASPTRLRTRSPAARSPIRSSSRSAEKVAFFYPWDVPRGYRRGSRERFWSNPDDQLPGRGCPRLLPDVRLASRRRLLRLRKRRLARLPRLGAAPDHDGAPSGLRFPPPARLLTPATPGLAVSADSAGWPFRVPLTLYLRCLRPRPQLLWDNVRHQAEILRGPRREAMEVPSGRGLDEWESPGGTSMIAGSETLVGLKASKVQLEVALICLKRRQAELERRRAKLADQADDPVVAARLVVLDQDLETIGDEVVPRRADRPRGRTTGSTSRLDRSSTRGSRSCLSPIRVCARSSAPFELRYLEGLRQLAEPLRRYQEAADRKSRLVRKLGNFGKDLILPELPGLLAAPPDRSRRRSALRRRGGQAPPRRGLALKAKIARGHSERSEGSSPVPVCANRAGSSGQGCGIPRPAASE